jgi:hypothetical protein
VAAPAGLPEFSHLIVKFLPLAAEDVGSGNYDVDLVGTRFYRAADLSNSLLHWGQARRKSRGDSGHSHPATLERSDRSFDEAVIHAGGRYFDVQFFNLKTP